jgi:glycosyltransferase involved in cell wall biosynthesis
MELLEFYKKNNVDLFINVSETEGIPVSIIEASSFGVVVIGTLVGGVGEILEEGENGFLVNQSCTPQEVANAITRFYDMPDAQKSHMRAKAIIIWQQKYSAENNYTDFLTSLMNLGSAEEVNLN